MMYLKKHTKTSGGVESAKITVSATVLAVNEGGGFETPSVTKGQLPAANISVSTKPGLKL